MSEKSGDEEGKIFHLGFEREKRKFDKRMEELQGLLDEEQRKISEGEKIIGDFRPGLREDLKEMRKNIMRALSDGNLESEKARELLDRINEAERDIKK